MSVKNKSEWLAARVVERVDETNRIIGVELAGIDSEPLPSFTAGSHIDIRVEDNLIRQYSICNDPDQPGRYRLGILLDENSRGGSKELHKRLVPGANIQISHPRNLFPLVDNAEHVTLLAGGIGITPLMSMAYELNHRGIPFDFHVCTRDSESVPFRSVLNLWKDQTHLHFSDIEDKNHPPLNQTTDIPDYQPGRYLYTCGPDGFMTHVRRLAIEKGWPDDAIREEHFSANPVTGGEEFRVVAHQSGVEIEVGPEETIAEALIAAGVEVQLCCEQGICGSCMTPVLEGVPDHRDLFMTGNEHAANNYITPCCSRSKTTTLVLDI